MAFDELEGWLMSDTMRDANFMASAMSACLIPPESVSVGAGDVVWVYIYDRKFSKRIRAVCTAIAMPCQIKYVGRVRPAGSERGHYES